MTVLLWLLRRLKYSTGPALSGRCGNALPHPSILLLTALWSPAFLFIYLHFPPSAARMKNKRPISERAEGAKKVARAVYLTATWPTWCFLSVGKHLAVSGHIIFLLIFLAGNERPIHFPPHSPQRFFDKPVSTLIAITTTGSCLATQVRLRKCHTYLMLHHRYLTKRIFFFSLLFLAHRNHASYFIRHFAKPPVCGQMGHMFYSCPLNICLSGCQKSSGSHRTPARDWL